MLDFARDASGTLKITSIREFVDSAFFKHFMKGMDQTQSGQQ
jgi:hypothetical protein